MSNYLSWNKIDIDKNNTSVVSEKYAEGFLFTRIKPGSMYQTRALRISLDAFQLSSENRRVQGKFPQLELTMNSLPIQPENYDWHIHKLGKEFYEGKLGVTNFSAAKIKSLLTTDHNFNQLFQFRIGAEIVGYSIVYSNDLLSHYAYPFYNFNAYPSNLGMAMMLISIKQSQLRSEKYFYLGSAQRAEDKYKLQFKGLEWFDGKGWQKDIEKLKEILQS